MYIYVREIGVYTPAHIAFVQYDNCPRARSAIGMILVSDSATPSAIVNQSAYTGPFPIIRHVLEYERFMFRVSHACGIASHCVVSRAPFHTERETTDVTRANDAPILKEPS